MWIRINRTDKTHTVKFDGFILGCQENEPSPFEKIEFECIEIDLTEQQIKDITDGHTHWKYNRETGALEATEGDERATKITTLAVF